MKYNKLESQSLIYYEIESNDSKSLDSIILFESVNIEHANNFV